MTYVTGVGAGAGAEGLIKSDMGVVAPLLITDVGGVVAVLATSD